MTAKLFRRLPLAALFPVVLFLGSLPSPAQSAEPATPESAAAVLDLRTFPVMEGAVVDSLRSLGLLMYDAPGGSKAAYEFQRKQLIKDGWKELPGGHHSPGNDVGQFARQGFSLMVSASDVLGDEKRKGWAHVALNNHGNVAADKLPVPKGMKPFGFQYGQAMYLTEASVADTAEASRKLLLDAGWLPYGNTGDAESPMYYFKQNGIRLSAWTSLAPAQGNKTMLRYATELLSADLPLFPEASDPRYDDFQQTLRFDVPGEDTAPIFKFYQDSLGKLGWKATTDHPITDDNKRTAFLVFRNDRGDLISLDLEQYTDTVRTKIDFDTAGEVKEQDRRAKLAAEKRRAEKAKADEEAEKLADTPPAEPAAEAQMPEIPDTDDLDGLLKAAEKASGQDLGDVRKAIQSAKGKNMPALAPPKPPAAKPDSNYKVPRVADLPMPEGAGVEFDRVTRIIKVTSADDIATLARFFLDGLGRQGWKTTQKPLITDDTAIIKLGFGNATLTIMANQANGGTEATLMSKGMAWDSIPESKLATRKPTPPAEEPAAEMPDETDSPDKDDKPKPARLRYAANIPTAEQQQTGATIRAAGKTYQLAYGVAYQAVDGDDTKTEVLLSTRPINVAKIVALLNNGQDGGDALGFDPCLKLRYDAQSKLSYLFLYADGMSINLGGAGEDKVRSTLNIDGGRAKGQAQLVEPGKFFDKEYNFTAPFNVKLITGTSGGSETPGPQPAESLGAEDYNGIPVPLITTSRSSIGSKFRKTVEVQVPAPLAAVANFYRRELSGRGWKEDASAAKVANDSIALAFSGSDGSMTVNLAKDADSTRAVVAARFPAKAKAAGIDPQAGKGRLILANAGDREVVIVINGQQYKVAAGKGAQNPKDGVSLHVLPGNYTVSMKSAGQEDKSEKIKIAIGETWGVIATPVGGYLADQLY